MYLVDTKIASQRSAARAGAMRAKRQLKKIIENNKRKMKIVSSSRLKAAAKAATMCGLKRRLGGEGGAVCVLPVVFINYTRQQRPHEQQHEGARSDGELGAVRGEDASRQLRLVASVGCACATNLLHLREIFIMISFSVFVFFEFCYNNKFQLKRLQYFRMISVNKPK